MSNAETAISSDDWKWKVQDAASNLIENTRIRKQMSADKKFNTAVKAELDRRLEDAKKAVVDTKEAVKKK